MASLMRTSNPALNAKTFERQVALGGEAMTVQGTVNKTGVLFLCVVATAAWAWIQFPQGGFSDRMALLVGVSAVGGSVVALATIFKKDWAPITSPIYALME